MAPLDALRQQVRVDLEDDRCVDAVDVAVAVGVGARGVRKLMQAVGVVLEDVLRLLAKS